LFDYFLSLFGKLYLSKRRIIHTKMVFFETLIVWETVNLYKQIRARSTISGLTNIHTGFFILICDYQSTQILAPALVLRRVIELVKICNFQLVSLITQKVFDLESWNLTKMLLSMCSCASGYFCVDIFSIFRVIPLT
jgi:hypothetical protein